MQNGVHGMIRRLSVFCLLLALVAASCRQSARKTPQPKAASQAQMQTIDNSDPRPVVIDPPPVLKDEAAPPKPIGQPWEPKQPVPLTADDEKVRAALPFAPAIGMDPVDGSKISILARTPTLEYKGHIFYFSSEENKRTFAANPDQYMKGLFKGA